jgi:hypothetical protein
LASLLGGVEDKDENMFAGIENETHAKEQVSLNHNNTAYTRLP